MIAPIIHNFTGSNQDCRRGCAEGSNGFWRLSGPKHTVMISCVYVRSCAYDHPQTRKMVQKENIIDNAPRTTADVKATDLSPVPTTKILAIGQIAQLTAEQGQIQRPKECRPLFGFFNRRWWYRQDGKGIVFMVNADP